MPTYDLTNNSSSAVIKAREMVVGRAYKRAPAGHNFTFVRLRVYPSTCTTLVPVLAVRTGMAPSIFLLEPDDPLVEATGISVTLEVLP